MTTTASDLLHRAEQRLTSLFVEEAGELGVTARQVTILQAVEKLPGASQTALVLATGVDRSTLAEVLRRLIARGLVTKKRSRLDERAFEVLITAEGRALLKRASSIGSRVEKRLLEQVPAARREAFLRDLAAISRHEDPSAE